MDKYSILKDKFGYDAFRPGQEEIIDGVMDTSKKGVLVVAPTSFGKSVCYQIPSILFGGLNIVISPLKSLMKDQVEALKSKGINASLYNSSLTEKDRKEIISQLNFGMVDILYIAPERFQDERFVDLLTSIEVSLFAIDEAHCVSMYGDFRPDYRKLKRAIEAVNPKQIVALTATATQRTQHDICLQLGFNEPRKFIRGFYRDNLAIEITQCSEDHTDRVVDEVSHFFEEGKDTGIIYTGTKKDAESFAGLLSSDEYNVPTKVYHAGLSDKTRVEVQDEWMKTGGPIAATTSLGMGVDKPNIRFIINSCMTGSIEDYAQMIGRAGRDGLLSFCKMFTNIRKDLWLQNFFIDMSCPPEKSIRDFWLWVNKKASKDVNGKIEMTQEAMANCAGIENSHVGGCMSILKSAGLIDTVGKGEYLVNVHQNPDDANINYDLIRNKREIKKEKLKDMMNYINNKKKCRMLMLMEYFDDKSHSDPCKKCDICTGKKNI